MNKIHPCIWFDRQAEEAASFYTSLFDNSKIRYRVPYGKAAAQASGQPEGSVMTVEFELDGLPFLALNGGPLFKPNPTISFFVGCETEKEIDRLWQSLKKTERMPLAKYPFAEKYGWCTDRFGVDWQLILGRRDQKITPALLFANDQYGKAEEAIHFYVSRFPDSKIGMIARDEKTKAVIHSSITLAETDFVIMEGPLEKEFAFTPGTSLIFECESQKEIDRIWKSLSAVPDAEQCGWLADPYGVSWQIVPKDWGKMIADSDPAVKERLMTAILGMKKPDLEVLRAISVTR